MSIYIYETFPVLRQWLAKTSKNICPDRRIIPANDFTSLLERLSGKYKEEPLFIIGKVEDEALLINTIERTSNHYSGAIVLILGEERFNNLLTRILVENKIKHALTWQDCDELRFKECLVCIEKHITYFSPGIQNIVFKYRQVESKLLRAGLSTRELEFISLYCNNQSAKSISLAMSISENTVSTYQERIKNKLNLNSIKELLLYVLKDEELKSFFMKL